MDDVLQEFISESWDNLAQLDNEIVELEKAGSDPELLASIFRTIHTIKGTCGFIGLDRLGVLAHSAENVLGQMRDGKMDVSESAISITLKAIDRIKDLLSAIEETGEEPDLNNNDLINQLDMLARIADDFAAPVAADQPEDQAVVLPPEEPTAAFDTVQPPSDETVQPPQAEASADTVEPEVAQSDSEAPAAVVEPETPAAPAAAAPPAEAAPQQVAATTGSSRSVSDLSIRVNVDVLDSLMNLVGELVLTRNQLLQLSRGDEESIYSAPISHLNRVTADLQEGVMKTRMQPIGHAWGRLPRLVRDLCQVTGKQIELQMHGAETELDRTVLDAIKDPLTHMVRNSADHGIESPEDRRAAGKPEVGTIRLDAFHEGGHVIIRIEDDGGGINIKRVRAKAIDRGIISESDAARLTEMDIAELIFQAGFSTAEEVTSVSGRGVGMDVVRTQIEKIGGMVDLQPVEGQGTCIRMKIPLTLAIISALVVESGDELFAIPQLGVVELVRLAAEDRHRIERIHKHEVLRLRDRLLPLVHLDDVLELKGSSVVGDSQDEEGENSTAQPVDDDVNIVVVQVGEDQLGLIVDEVFDTEEIVVKPVGSLLKEIGIYQGTTILGDGRVIMILDVSGIAAEIGGLNSISREIERADGERDVAADMTSVLLFNVGGGRTMSVPLALVSRLEEFTQEQIERTGDRDLVQYRGDLLPLLPVDGYARPDEQPMQPVIVFSEGDKAMGLMIEEIDDIIEEELVIRIQSERPGVLGTAIVNSKATDIIDAQHYLKLANPHWFENNHSNFTARVLFAEDSMFFRQLAATSLETAGYEVTAVEDGARAIEVLEHGGMFEAIISDIEMPEVGGLELARWVRARNQYNDVPMIALSGNMNPTLEKQCTDSGFNQFLRKFDPEELRQVLDGLCRTKTPVQGVPA
jgi:two-component system chemotaxis sensor kinase CheA